MINIVYLLMNFQKHVLKGNLRYTTNYTDLSHCQSVIRKSTEHDGWLVLQCML